MNQPCRLLLRTSCPTGARVRPLQLRQQRGVGGGTNAAAAGNGPEEEGAKMRGTSATSSKANTSAAAMIGNLEMRCFCAVRRLCWRDAGAVAGGTRQAFTRVAAYRDRPESSESCRDKPESSESCRDKPLLSSRFPPLQAPPKPSVRETSRRQPWGAPLPLL